MFRSVFFRRFLAGLCLAAAAASSAAGEETVRVGVLSTESPWFFVDTFGPTMKELRRSLPDKTVVTREYEPEALLEAIKSGEVDLFMASSGFFVWVTAESGARHLATRHRPEARDPSLAVGSVFAVRSDSKTLRTPSDLKGRRIAAADSMSFDGWLTALGALTAFTDDPEHFFGDVLFTGYGQPDPAALVMAGEADAAVLEACALERLIASGALAADSLRILGERKQDDLACRVSTPLYPDMVFASMPSLSSRLVKRITLTLLSMPPGADGAQWGFASSFKNVTALFRDLQLGPYAWMRETTPAALLKRYGAWIAGAAIAALLVFFYILSVRRIVAVRTRDLIASQKAREALEARAAADRERLAQLERAGVVSELSSMIAHEVRQPVASLVNYATGLRMYLAETALSGDPVVTEATEEITGQARRISGIVERVRSYARRGRKMREPCDLADLVRRALKTFEHSSAAAGVRITTGELANAPVTADPLEIELVIVNLLKNAARAAAGGTDPEPAVRLELSASASFWRITVSDSGPVISEERFASLCAPVRSIGGGLGLGLSICRVIAESHGGRLSFERLKPSGIAACFFIPREGDAPAAEVSP